MHIEWNADWVQGIAVHGGGWIVIVLITAWLLLGDPLLGRVAYQRFLSALKSGEPDVRVRFYLRWTWQGWALALLVLTLATGVLGWSPAQLGLRLPHVVVAVPTQVLTGILVGIVAGVATGVIIARKQTRSGSKPPARRLAPSANAMLLLPRSTSERRAFALLSLTAGITEELVWRGFGLALLVAVFPQMPLIADAIILAVTFGWAHVYQGAAGVLGTTILGGLLTALYLATGSLLLPMLLHVVIDLAAMLRAPDAAPDATTPPGSI